MSECIMGPCRKLLLGSLQQEWYYSDDQNSIDHLIYPQEQEDGKQTPLISG